MKARLFTLVVTGLFTAGVARAEKKAVLVGIDDFEKVRDLRGCLEDVRTMERLLTEKLGFPPGNIKKLLNGDATRQNIEGAVRSTLVEGSAAGDEMVFFMSSHGTQIKDENGDEDDHLDEALVTYDTSPKPVSKLYVDDDLGALLAQSKAARVLVIIDTCHSGTITKGIGFDEMCQNDQAKAMRENGGRHLDLYCEEDNAEALPPMSRSLDGGASRNLEVMPMDLNNSVVMISAAQPQQVAMPITVDNLSHGAFTYFFDRGVRGEADANQDGKVSFAEMKAFVDKNLDGRPTIEQKVFVGASSPDDAVFPDAKISNWSGLDQGVGAFRVSLQPASAQVKSGETVRFTVQTEKPGYLLLFERSPQGQLRVLVPNGYQESVGPIRLAAGSTVVPGETDFWSLEAAAPTGRWEYKAIVSEKPLTSDQLVSIDQGYLKAEGSAAEALAGSVRNLVVEPPAAASGDAANVKYAIASASVEVR